MQGFGLKGPEVLKALGICGLVVCAATASTCQAEGRLTLRTDAPELRLLSDGATNLIPCTVYPPEQATRPKPAGLVVHLPGAGGTHTFYNLSRPPYAVLRQLLAKRGYWVVVPGLGGGHWMNDKAVASMDAVIAGMITTERIDPGRVTILGTSMGAGSGLIYAGKRSKTVRGICAIFPMTDFNAWLTEMPIYASIISQAYGVKTEELAPIFEERSPIHHPEAFDNIAVYLLHGAADTVVPPHHSREFAAALKARGCSVNYREVPGFGHKDEIAEAYQKEIADFLTGMTEGRNTTNQ